MQLYIPGRINMLIITKLLFKPSDTPFQYSSSDINVSAAISLGLCIFFFFLTALF